MYMYLIYMSLEGGQEWEGFLPLSLVDNLYLFLEAKFYKSNTCKWLDFDRRSRALPVNLLSLMKAGFFPDLTPHGYKNGKSLLPNVLVDYNL